MSLITPQDRHPALRKALTESRVSSDHRAEPFCRPVHQSGPSFSSLVDVGSQPGNVAKAVRRVRCRTTLFAPPRRNIVLGALAALGPQGLEAIYKPLCSNERLQNKQRCNHQRHRDRAVVSSAQRSYHESDLAVARVLPPVRHCTAGIRAGQLDTCDCLRAAFGRRVGGKGCASSYPCRFDGQRARRAAPNVKPLRTALPLLIGTREPSPSVEGRAFCESKSQELARNRHIEAERGSVANLPLIIGSVSDFAIVHYFVRFS